MASFLKKTLIAGAASLTLVGAVATTTAPAEAWYRGGGGGAVAAGVIGGLAAGAIVGSAASNAYGYPAYAGPPPAAYGGCYFVRRPVYDEYGNYMGRRPVRVCD